MADNSYSGPDADTGFASFYEKQRANAIAQRKNKTGRGRELSESDESDLTAKSLQQYKDLPDRDKARYRFDSEKGATATDQEKSDFKAELNQRYDLSGRRSNSLTPQEQWKQSDSSVGTSGDVMTTNSDGKRVVNPQFNKAITEGYREKYPTTGNNAKPVPEPSSNNGEVQVAGVANAEGRVGGSKASGSSAPEISKVKEDRDKDGRGYTDSESYSAFQKTRPTASQDYDAQFNKGPMGTRLNEIQTAQDAGARNSLYSTDRSAERKMADAGIRNELQDERELIKKEYDKGAQVTARYDEDQRQIARGRTLGFDKERQRSEKGFVADRTQFADLDERYGYGQQVVTGRKNENGMAQTSIKNKDGSTGSLATTSQSTDDRTDALKDSRRKELIAGGMDEKSARTQSTKDIQQIYMEGDIDDYNQTKGQRATKKADYTALDDKDRISALKRNNYDASKLGSDKEYQSVLAQRSGDKKVQGMSADFEKQKTEMAEAKPEVAKPVDFFKQDGSIDKTTFARVSDKPLPYKDNAPATNSKPAQAISTPKYEGDAGYEGQSGVVPNKGGTAQAKPLETPFNTASASNPNSNPKAPDYNGPEASPSAEATDLARKKKKNPNQETMIA